MEETTIDLRDVIKTIKKRRKLILEIFAAMVIAAVVISFIIPPTYEAETTLRVKQPKGLGDSLLSGMPGGSFNAKQLMSTYAEILKSRTVVQKVIDETQSDKDEPPTYESFLKKITTQPVKDTEILKVKVQAGTPEEAQETANLLVNTFIGRMTELVRLEHKNTREFIGQRLVEAKKELEQSETALEQYKLKNKVVDPEQETKALLDKLSSIDKLSAENRVGLEAAQARMGTANKQLGSEKPGFIADSPLIQQYKGKLAELEVELVSLSQNYTDKHPKVQAVQAAIAETRASLAQEAARIVAQEAPSMNPIHQGLLQAKIQSEAEIAARTAQKAAIDKIISEGDKELTKLPTKEHGLAKVLRDARVNQEIYVMLAKRHEEARIAEVMEPTDVQVIDVAIAPEKPVSPKKTLNVVIAGILGLFIGTGTAFGLEYLNKSITCEDDVKSYLELPVLGKIPDFDSEEPKQKESIFAKFKQLFASQDKNKRHNRHG